MNIIIFVLVGISLFSLTTFTSYALFTNEAEGSNSISLTVSTSGIISIRIFAQNDGTEVGTLSDHQNIIKFNVEDGYVYKDNSLSCKTKNGEAIAATYNKASNILTINNATKSGTCEIRFENGYRKLHDIILSEPLVVNNGLSVTTETNTGKPSYYYKGTVNNNYVSFAGQTWRIMRINEDSSIRLIKAEMVEAITYTTVDIAEKRYYSNTGTEGVKKYLDDWYNTNLSNYDSKIVQNTYCEESKTVFDSVTYNNDNASPIIKEKYTPNLKCTNDGNGKGPLSLKIGLMSLDEAMLSGYRLTDEESPISHIRAYAFTMSPVGYLTNGHAHIWMTGPDNKVTLADTTYPLAVLPVINLRADTLITQGDGSATNPYVVV